MRNDSLAQEITELHSAHALLLSMFQHEQCKHEQQLQRLQHALVASLGAVQSSDEAAHVRSPGYAEQATPGAVHSSTMLGASSTAHPAIPFSLGEQATLVSHAASLFNSYSAVPPTTTLSVVSMAEHSMPQTSSSSATVVVPSLSLPVSQPLSLS